MKLHHFSATAAAGTALLLASPVHAQDGEWTFRIAPYLLVPSMEGDVTLRGREVETDVGPEDIFSRLNFGFQGYLEASTDTWGIGLDVIYMNLDATDDDRIVDIDVKQSAYSPTAFVRVSPNIDLYAGVRFNSIGGDADFQGPLGAGTVEQDESWVDPLIGMRFSTPLGEKWNLQISGDVGGVVAGSDIALNIWPMVGYEISDSAQLTFGYRVLYTDYRSGSGAGLFEYDMLTTGPVVGAVFDF
jgi:hypothetical protein